MDSKQSRKKNLVTGGKDAQGVDKVAAQLKKGLKKTDEGRARERDDAEVEIDLDVGLLGPGTAAKKGKGKAAKKAAGAQPGDDEDESEDGEDDLRVGPTAFRQRDLVAQAFAGDNVIEVSPVLISTSLLLRACELFPFVPPHTPPHSTSSDPSERAVAVLSPNDATSSLLARPTSGLVLPVRLQKSGRTRPANPSNRI